MLGFLNASGHQEKRQPPMHSIYPVTAKIHRKMAQNSLVRLKLSFVQAFLAFLHHPNDVRIRFGYQQIIRAKDFILSTINCPKFTF